MKLEYFNHIRRNVKAEFFYFVRKAVGHFMHWYSCAPQCPWDFLRDFSIEAMEDKRSPPAVRDDLVLWTWYYRTKSGAGQPVHDQHEKPEIPESMKSSVSAYEAGTKNAKDVKMVMQRGQEDEEQEDEDVEAVENNLLELRGYSYRIDYKQIRTGLLNDYV